MRPNPQLPADLVTFTEEILKGKLHFLCSDNLLNDLSDFNSIFRKNVTYDNVRNDKKGPSISL